MASKFGSARIRFLMFHSKRLASIALISALHWTCSAAEDFAVSKIADRTTLNAIISEARSGLQMRIKNDGETEGGGVFRAMFETFLSVECDDVNRQRFMSALRARTQKFIGDQGATIANWGTRGPESDLSAFSWEYGWKENSGVFLVRYFPNSDGKGQLTIFCYEHRRGAPPLPRAKGF